MTTHWHTPRFERRGTSLAWSVAVISRKRHLCHGSSTYSPDLAPADFWVFQKLKIVLKRKRFSNVVGIKSSVKEMLTDIPV
jgi:hypothetical protein